MKWVTAIIFMILAAGAILQAADASGKIDSTGIDAKKVEDKIAEALVRIEQAKLSRSPPVNSTNSTLENIRINSSLRNSSFPAKFDNNQSGQMNVGSSSKGSYGGYYDMTASRHEMGKSGIDSKMFLSGNFEMDKTVKFQDQGV
jgi:hypothetical protein